MMTPHEILERLNPQQQKAVKDYEGPALIIAGAGSGKTSVVVSRTAYMIANGIHPKNILLFTFTRKAAEEMKERAKAMIGESADVMTICTYHSFCLSLIRKYYHLLGFEKGFTILSPSESTDLIESLIKTWNHTGMAIEKGTIERRISMLKNSLISPSMAKEEIASEYDIVLTNVYEEYQRELKKRNTLDFNDLIYFAMKLLEREDVLTSVQERYHYIIADESQDSNLVNLNMIAKLSGKKKNMCLVGDDYQSIYSFRGANIDAFFSFTKVHRLKEFLLERNYRSTKTIVSAANSLMRHNKKQFKKTAYSEGEDGPSIKYLTLRGQAEEGDMVCATIKALLQRGYEHKDIAVLYRMSYLSRAVEDALLKEGIPYTMLGGTPFYERKEIKDILCYLRFLINMKDSFALSRILNVPRRYIGPQSLEILLSCSVFNPCAIMNVNVLDEKMKLLKLNTKTIQGVLSFASIIRQLREKAKTLSVPALIDEVQRQTNYMTYLKEFDETTFFDRLENIKELRRLAEGFSTLDDFVQSLGTFSQQEDASDANKVNLLTVHQSKGLEWKAVLVIGCNDMIFPHAKAMEEGKLDEERRLFYVAMTRAKEHLFLMRPKHMHRYAKVGNSYCPSRFIHEIDQAYLDCLPSR